MTAKKLWSILRVIFMMVKKGISKSKLVMDLNMIFKSCNQLASRAINGLIIHHHNFICRPNEPNDNFINPEEYEFSCSNSPAVGPIQQYLLMGLAQHKRPNKLNHHRHQYNLEDPATVAAVHRVLEMIHTHEGPVVAPSPPPFMEFGNGNGNKSPFVRQLRVTDSPFPLKDGTGNNEEEEEDIKVGTLLDLSVGPARVGPYVLWTGLKLFADLNMCLESRQPWADLSPPGPMRLWTGPRTTHLGPARCGPWKTPPESEHQGLVIPGGLR
ncbi:hypothetical protein Cgig2_027493 [Carnegiea gigantea]|uniref:Uncharacterized protein n=1 Tax=Carnegiea gigantea TaxID=171969 RepID=A0A9Q1KLA7_9CARY|nr:hypothetical protein Cgig2_027493 [Carnegiea gigantea]